jgi:hypothetical protein
MIQFVDRRTTTGGHGNADATPEGVCTASRDAVLSSLKFSAAGLAGVKANTRGAIFDTLRRKGTFGTSGHACACSAAIRSRSS